MLTNALNTIKTEIAKLKNALKKQSEYEIDEENDPVSLLFDWSYHLGTATLMPEFMIYNMPTADEDKEKRLAKSWMPYNDVGYISMRWYPCDEEGTEIKEEEMDEADYINDEQDLIGKEWRFACEIEHIGGMPMRSDELHIEYEFYGELFKTEIVTDANANEVDLHHKQIHEVLNVDQSFIDYLKTTNLAFTVYSNPYIDPDVKKGWTSLTTKNEVIAKNLNCPPVNYKKQVATLNKIIEKLQKENKELKKQLAGKLINI